MPFSYSQSLQKAIPELLQKLNLIVNQGTDVQLKIVQTLLLLLTYCPDVHGNVLGDVLILYLNLHQSKASVVSSTALASLRQATVLILDRVQAQKEEEEDRRHQITLSDGTLLRLTDYEWDAYHLFKDLCVKTSSSLGYDAEPEYSPKLLREFSTTPTLGLELIESIMSGSAEPFRTVCAHSLSRVT